MTTIWDLIETQTEDEILADALALATIAGLPVTSWRTGDPTLSEYEFLAEFLAAREDYAAELIKAAWLSLASGEWLTVVAREVFGVERETASYASSTVTITNSGAGYYGEPAAGELAFQNSTTGKTYHSTAVPSGPIVPGATVNVAVAADEAGTDSAAAADEIDTLVTGLIDVVVTASTVATATDEQTDAELRTACANTLGALSPDGPRDAYEYVACNTELTGDVETTRAHSTEDSSTGEVDVYIAGASGAVSAGAVALVQAAIDTWATPLCITATVASASAVEQAVTFTVSGDDLPADPGAACELALGALVAVLAIGGTLTRSALIVTIHTTLVAAGASNVSVSLTVPAADVTLDDDEVLTLGTVTGTEV